MTWPLGSGVLQAQNKMPTDPVMASKWLADRGEVVGKKDGHVRVVSLGLGNVSLSELTIFPKLQSLRLGRLGIPEPINFESVPEFKNLEHLEILMGRLSEEDVQSIAKVPKLKTLRIVNSLSFATLAPLGNSSTLEKLELDYCYGLNLDTLESLAKCSALTELNIGDVSKSYGEPEIGCLTDRHLELISRIPSLQRLTIQRAHQITDAGLEKIAASSNLQQLDIAVDKVTGSTLSQFPTDQLSELKIDCREFSDAGWAAISNMTKLQRLSVITSVKKFKPEEPWSLGKSAGLITELELCQFRFENDEFKNATSLKKLSLNECSGLTNSNMENLSSIESLALDRCIFRQAEIEMVAKLASLKELTIRRTRARSQWLNPLAKLENLEKVSLVENRFFDDAAIEVVSKAPSLKSLVVTGNSKVTDAALQFLAQSKQLEELEFKQLSKMTLSGFESFAPNHPINSLRLENLNSVSTQGIETLSRLENLKTLKLHRMRLKDDSIKAIGKIVSLTNLRMTSSHTHEQSGLVKKMVRSLPNLIGRE